MCKTIYFIFLKTSGVSKFNSVIVGILFNAFINKVIGFSSTNSKIFLPPLDRFKKSLNQKARWKEKLFEFNVFMPCFEITFTTQEPRICGD